MVSQLKSQESVACFGVTSVMEDFLLDSGRLGKHVLLVGHDRFRGLMIWSISIRHQNTGKIAYCNLGPCMVSSQ